MQTFVKKRRIGPIERTTLTKLTTHRLRVSARELRLI